MRIVSFSKFAAWGLIGAIVFVTVCPINLRPTTETTVNLDRALAFAMAGGAFAMAYPRRWWLLLLLLPPSAFGIEALQYISPTRHPHFPDAVFKALGATSGVLVGHFASMWIEGRTRRMRLAD